MLVRRGFPRSRVDVVYNGLDFRQAVEAEPRGSFLKRHNVPDCDGELLVGCLGRLYTVKGQDALIAAVDKLLGSGEWRGKLRLLLAGDGEARRAWEERTRLLGIGDRVHFLGHLQDGYSFLRALDIHVLPSLSESLPYALLEAALVHTACVATAVGGVPEIIHDGVTGLLVPPGDAGALAGAIASLAADPELRRRMGDALHSHAAGAFSLDQMVDTHLQAYRELLGTRSGRL
jgi:glycosyltransferase involved in cell wall biosynthesis